MEALGADVMITGSQKALACPPGISILVLSKNAVNRIENSPVKSFYFNLKDALKNAERGQTPFTPAVSIILQLNVRLRTIENDGGIEIEREKIKNIANDFRKRIKEYPFEIPSNSLSNAVTPLHPLHTSAYEIFETLKNDYDIWVCPNGGNLKDKILRVGHIGNLNISDNDILFAALDDMKKRKLL
jgi:aspartate aminotransferase-like enzyme